MDVVEYRRRGKEMVDYIADYLENIRDRRVFPDVKPGYMHNLLPDSAPVEGEKWETIFGDIERVIMPGVTHWQSPHMHAYFPALNSFPSLLGDMLADAINCIGFTWASSPACTELETIVMNWLGKMIGLPNEFLHLDNNKSKGGGVLQTTASESTLVCLLAGRTLAIQKFHEKTTGYQDAEINARLVAYCSDQAHSSVEKAALIGLVRMRYIETDDNLSMRGQVLQDAIEDDIKQGLIPFWVCNTLGTTGACAFDNLEEVGNVCQKYNLWLHIDAAYAGSALICPEYRTWLKGIEKSDSISFNPSKWLMVHFDCTALWVKDVTAVHRTFNVEPLYLQHENSGSAIDYMHWQIPLSKRFRALKLWFVLRSFGIKGLQKHIREGVRLAQKFEALVLADHRFEVPAKRHLGLVVFRMKGENELTERLLKRLNHRGNLHCVPASLKGKYIIRFTVTSTLTTTEDILTDWTEIKKVATDVLNEVTAKLADRAKVPLKDTKDKNEAFGSSLLLSNSPLSPKIVNGSFAAIFDADEFLAKTYAGIRIAHQDSPSMRRRVRGIMMSGKQFSLDSRMDLVVQSCYESGSSDSTEKLNPSNNKTIREDSEEYSEAYESLGTPPNTPPPTVSPMFPLTIFQQLSGMEEMEKITLQEEKMKIYPIQHHQQINKIKNEKVLVYTKANTLTIPKISTTFHNFDKIVSLNNSLQCCNSKKNNLLSNNNNNNQNNQNNNLIKLETLQATTIKNILTESSTNSTTATLLNCNNTGCKPKNIYYNIKNSTNNENNKEQQYSTLSTSSWLAKDNNDDEQSTKKEIYHGKRFLEPLQNFDGGICAFYNLGFDAIMSQISADTTQSSSTSSSSSQKLAFHRSVYAFDKQMSEIFEETEVSSSSSSVDWNGIKENFKSNKNSDIIQNQINKKSLDWTSIDSSDVYLTEGELYENEDGAKGINSLSVDDWDSLSNKIIEKTKKDECCVKCGHHTTSSSGTNTSRSSSTSS